MEPFRYECGALRLIADAFMAEAVATACLLQTLRYYMNAVTEVLYTHMQICRRSPPPTITYYAPCQHDTISLHTQASQYSDMVQETLSNSLFRRRRTPTSITIFKYGAGNSEQFALQTPADTYLKHGGHATQNSAPTASACPRALPSAFAIVFCLLLHRPRAVVTYNIHAESV